MNDHLLAAYESMRERMPSVSYEKFVKITQGWVIHPIDIDGKPAGALLVRGPELHACVLPVAFGRWMNRRMLRVLNEVIDRHGCAVTRVTTKAGKKFVCRLGFVEHSRAGDVVIYRKAKNGL